MKGNEVLLTPTTTESGMVPYIINIDLPKLFISKGGQNPPELFLGEGGLCIGPYSVESILLTDLFWDVLPK